MSQLVAARVRATREARALSAEALAARCGSVSVNTIWNIENGRRQVSVDLLGILAAALDVPPLYLLTPPDDAPPLVVGPDLSFENAESVRRWTYGLQPPPEGQSAPYFEAAAQCAPQVRPAGVPGDEAATRLTQQFTRQAEDFVSLVRSQVDVLLADLQGSETDDVQAAIARARAQLSATAPAGPAPED